MLSIKKSDLLISDKLMDSEIDRFVSILGEKTWKKKIKNFQNEIKSSNTIYYGNYLIQRNPLLVPLEQYFSLIESDKVIQRHNSVELKLLFSISWCANKMFSDANAIGKERIWGFLFSEDVRPFIFEIQTVTHLLRNGFEVELNDINSTDSNAPNFDFIVRKGSFTGEVECKRKNPDAGSKVPRDTFYRLADLIVNQIRGAGYHMLIDIRLKNRLAGSSISFKEVSQLLHRTILAGKSYCVVDENLSIHIEVLPTNLVVENDAQANILLKKYRTGREHIAILGGEGLLVIRAESESNDQMLTAIYKSLKKTVKQFSGNNAALIATYVEGITMEEFQVLLDDGGLRLVAQRFFKNTERDFIHTVAFTSDQTITGNGPVYTSSGPVAFWDNYQSKYSYKVNPFGLKGL